MFFNKNRSAVVTVYAQATLALENKRVADLMAKEKTATPGREKE